MRVLVVNTGSTSVKLHVLDADDRVVDCHELGPIEEPETQEVLERVVRDGTGIDAAGHRIVHGGPDLADSVVVDDQVLERLVDLDHLAPLHNPPARRAADIVRRLRPDLPAVACFDTAFHATLPAHARTWAVPWRWTTEWGLRRYGFHGLGHQWATKRAAELLGRPVEELRLVTSHLGGGASLAAVRHGASVDTTMGYTPLDGLVMGTRSGAVDPGAVLAALRHSNGDVDRIERDLNEDSGLLGLSGVSHDLRDVFAAADTGNNRAALAIDVYVRSLRAGIAAMATAMGGLDALVFSGEAGAGSPRLRAETCDGLGFLGLHLDLTANAGADAVDGIIGDRATTAEVLAVAPQEELIIASEVRRVLAA